MTDRDDTPVMREVYADGACDWKGVPPALKSDPETIARVVAELRGVVQVQGGELTLKPNDCGAVLRELALGPVRLRDAQQRIEALCEQVRSLGGDPIKVPLSHFAPVSFSERPPDGGGLDE